MVPAPTLPCRSFENIVNPRKLEHRFRMILAGIPYALLYGQQDNDVPTFWLLLYLSQFER